MADQHQRELERAFNDFMSKVNRAKKDYNQKIDVILKKIDALKIAQVKRKLNI